MTAPAFFDTNILLYSISRDPAEGEKREDPVKDGRRRLESKKPMRAGVPAPATGAADAFPSTGPSMMSATCRDWTSTASTDLGRIGGAYSSLELWLAASLTCDLRNVGLICVEE